MAKKSIAKNSVYNVLYKGFTAVFPLLTTAYVSRMLLPEGVGKVSYAQTVVTYFTVFASLGIPSYGVKAIASAGEENGDRNRCFFELLLINGMATLLCLGVYYGIVNFTGIFDGKIALMNVMGSMLILNFLSIDWFYQGIEEYSYIATRSILVKILSFAAMLLFVKSPADYLIYGVILCVATAGNYVLNCINVKKYVSSVPRSLHIGKHLKPVLILLASSIATEIYTMLDTVMLEFFHGDAAVGYYSNAVKIVRMVYTVTVALVATFYPRISQCFANHDKQRMNELLTIGTKIILLLALPFVAGTLLLADQMVPILLGASFMPSVLTLRILSVLIFVFSVAYFLGHVVLMASGNEKSILYATIAGAVLNAAMNAVLIPRFAQDGAAIASVSAEVVVTVVLIGCSRKTYRLDISKKYIATLLGAVGVMCAVVWFMKGFLAMGLLNLFVIVGCAGVVYFAVLAVLKNELMMRVVERALRIVKRGA